MPLETVNAVAARLGLPRVDVVKINVEGGEANVIAGARAMLAAIPPVLMMEVSDGTLRARGNSEVALLETLRGELGYEIRAFSDIAGLVQELTEGTPLSANIAASPLEKRSTVPNSA